MPTDPIKEKLTRILATKAVRGGEFVLPFEPADFPLNLSARFSDFSRFALEIGCGWGEFTRAWANQHPDRLIIALEKKLARVLSSSRTQRLEGQKNIRYLILDIAWFFDNIFQEGQFETITINFPDPWPKLRHHKHRFITPAFAAELGRIATHRARFLFATDNYLYAREAAEVFEEATVWKNVQGSYLVRTEIPSRPQSYFEQLHRNEGALIYFLEYEKT